MAPNGEGKFRLGMIAALLLVALPSYLLLAAGLFWVIGRSGTSGGMSVFLVAGGLLFIAAGTVETTRRMARYRRRIESETARLRDALIQSGRLAELGRVGADLAHELNTPLSIIKEQAGWIRDLISGEDVPESASLKEIRTAVESIERNGERARTLVLRMLNFSRPSAPVRELVDVNRLAAETVDFIRKMAKYRQIAITTDYAPDLPPVKSDPAALQQVFMNILNNAADAVEKGGTIAVNTHADAQHREIVVAFSDNGPGIPPAHRDRVFDAFFTTKTADKGTGLGLSISREIMTRLGGRIAVTDAEGGGAVFTVHLPRDDDGGASRNEENGS